MSVRNIYEAGRRALDSKEIPGVLLISFGHGCGAELDNATSFVREARSEYEGPIDRRGETAFIHSSLFPPPPEKGYDLTKWERHIPELAKISWPELTPAARAAFYLMAQIAAFNAKIVENIAADIYRKERELTDLTRKIIKIGWNTYRGYIEPDKGDDILGNPGFDKKIGKIGPNDWQEWQNFLPDEVKDNWKILPPAARAVAYLMASKQADSVRNDDY